MKDLFETRNGKTTIFKGERLELADYKALGFSEEYFNECLTGDYSAWLLLNGEIAEVESNKNITGRWDIEIYKVITFE